MSEVRLVVLEADQELSGTIHGSDADRAVAALSADPTTMEEFEAAVSRFAKRDGERRFFSNLRPSSYDDEPYDAGLVVIDLIGRLVVVESTYSNPAHEGSVQYHCGHRQTDISLRYHLADDWKFLKGADGWRHWSQDRRKERAANPDRDHRPVFYGKQLLEFIARKTFAEFARRVEIESTVRARWAEADRKRRTLKARATDEPDSVPAADAENITCDDGDKDRYRSPFYDTLKQIHVDWMLTARDDLGGLSPREVIFQKHSHLDWDQQDRCEYWTALQSKPPTLSEESFAYKYAGFGTNEIVMYYDMVRALLWSCWERLDQLAASTDASTGLESMLVGDFLPTEIPRLQQVRDEWLDTVDSEYRGRTPHSIIHQERIRLPDAMSGRDAMIDPDCPCCQMMVENSGPWFWHFDGSGMDDEFAFDLRSRTREEWDAEEKRREEFNRRFEAEWDERERLGVQSSRPNEDGCNSVWSKSFSVGETENVPLGIRVFGIGCKLAELIVGLRGQFPRESAPPETQSYIDQLNRDFGNLREILGTSDVSLAENLLTPVLDRFNQTLDEVAEVRPELIEKCEVVKEEIDGLFDAPPDPGAYLDIPDDPDWGTDGDVPF